MKITIYDKNLDVAGYAGDYKSLIWAERAVEIGDCELYVPASAENLALYRIGYYIAFDESDMICVIRKIEIQTDLENGDYFAVTGIDVRVFCDQRIMHTYDPKTFSGYAEVFLRDVVQQYLIDDEEGAMRLPADPVLSGEKLIQLGTLQGMEDKIEAQINYRNIGELIREFCRRFGWGWRFTKSNKKFSFALYTGEDRSAYMIFSPERYNVIRSDYKDDLTNMQNTFYVAGSGEGTRRKVAKTGDTYSTERYDAFIDAREIANRQTWADIKAAYPLTEDGGTGHFKQVSQYVEEYLYCVYDFETVIPKGGTAEYWLRHDIGLQAVLTDLGNGMLSVYVPEMPIANNFTTTTPDDEDEYTINQDVYYCLLAAKALDPLAEHAEVTSMTADIVPDVGYIYGTDYVVGDIVKIENGYGISQKVRITEAIRVWDENGYQINISYENV